MDKEIYKNYRVYFDEQHDRWVADDVKTYDRVATDPSRKKLLSILDQIDKKQFERFDVLSAEHNDYGRYTVTSIVPEGAWITLQEGTSNYRKGRREKLTYGFRDLLPVTKHNLVSVKKIKGLHERIENIKSEINEVAGSMDEMNAEIKAKFNIYLSERNQIE